MYPVQARSEHGCVVSIRRAHGCGLAHARLGASFLKRLIRAYERQDLGSKSGDQKQSRADFDVMVFLDFTHICCLTEYDV